MDADHEALLSPSNQAVVDKMISSKKLVAILEQKRLDMRSRLPKLNRKQIRRFRMPYDEAVLEELEEDDFIHSAEFLRQLMTFQENFRNEHSYDSVIMARPVLRQSSAHLEMLATSFRIAETAHFHDNVDGEVDELLKLAVKYGLEDETGNWWWLSEQVFLQCTELTENYFDDGGFRKAESRYIFAKFLIENGISKDRGLTLMEETRLLCENQDWICFEILGKNEKTMFIQVCTIIYECLIQKIKEILLCNPKQALNLCMIAKERVLEACLDRAEILMMQGRCEMENGMFEDSIRSLVKAYLLYKNQEKHEECCEAMIQLALAYMQIDVWDKSTKMLDKAYAYAEEHNLRHYIGKVLLCMGQYHLNHGTPKMSTPFLTQAFAIFHELNDTANREYVQNLGAVSRGLELLASYVDLILNCEIGDEESRHDCLMQLCRWKDNREDFLGDLRGTIFWDRAQVSGISVGIKSPATFDYGAPEGALTEFPGTESLMSHVDTAEEEDETLVDQKRGSAKTKTEGQETSMDEKELTTAKKVSVSSGAMTEEKVASTSVEPIDNVAKDLGLEGTGKDETEEKVEEPTVPEIEQEGTPKAEVVENDEKTNENAAQDND